MTNTTELRAYLLREYESGGLCVVAAKTKLSESMLRDIVIEGEVISDVVAELVSGVMG